MEPQAFVVSRFTSFLSGCILFIFLFSRPVGLIAQPDIQISGRITDYLTGEPLVGVNVSIPEKFKGTVSNTEGYFFFRVSGEVLPFMIRISMVGYRAEEYEVNRIYESGIRVRLVSETILAEEVVITAPVVEVEQKLFRELTTVEMIDALGVRETPAHSYYEAIAYLKGVDVTTQSLQFLTVNARGFNSTENLRFKQVVDGMDNQAPGFSFPVGNISGLAELDVETIEFLPGPASTEYGNNTLNGILQMKSKDPFTYRGLSISVKPGVADLRPGSDYPFQFYGKPLADASLRYAEAVGRLGFKINASFMKGRDWYADDTTNVRPGNIYYEKDPGHDGLNQYGDEITRLLPVGENLQMIPVSRTGYRDKYLVDDRVENLKLSSAIHYKLGEHTTAILYGNYGRATTVYAGDNRISLSGFEMYQAKAELRGRDYSLMAYTSRQNTANAYDSRNLAVNLNRFYKSDEQWFSEYRNAYLGYYRRFGITPYDHDVARAVADNGRLIPGTAQFEEVKRTFINSSGQKWSAGIVNNSSLHEARGQYRLPLPDDDFPGIRLGANYRFVDLESEGTMFPDSAGNDISFFEYGGFVEADKKLFGKKLHLSASLRFDHSENFRVSLSPRFSALYNFSEYRNLRFSVLTGSRFPGAKEQFIHQDLGHAIYLGGLPEMYAGYDFPDNAIYLDQVVKFSGEVDRMVSDPDNPLTQTQAVLRNLHILEKGIVREEDFREFEPEKVISFELGYKAKIANSFFFDMVYYHSTYTDFIGYVKVLKPRISPSSDIYAAAAQVSNSAQRDVFYLYKNSDEHISLQGMLFGVKWATPLGSILAFNATWSDIRQLSDDPLVPGFNTPAFKANLSIANRKLDRMENNPGFRNVGFHINWRYQSAIDWESPYASGRIDRFSTTDFQLSYSFAKPRSVLKAGVNNFLNIIHTNSFGGPEVGIFYFVTYTIDSLFD